MTNSAEAIIPQAVTPTHAHDVGDKVIVLAGAGAIGTATARRLGAGGAKLVIGDISSDAAEAAADAARQEGGEARPVRADISEEGDVARIVTEAADRFGRIDGLFNVAADLSPENLGNDKDALGIPLDVWRHTLDVNLTGYLLTIRAALPHMLEQGAGAIVNVISAAAYVGEPERVAYGVSKAGLTALTRHLARRYGKEGITANAISPGGVPTEGTRREVGDEALAAYLATLPSPRLGTPDDIAAMAVHLLSADGRWINGQCICVDGGGTMRP